MLMMRIIQVKDDPLLCRLAEYGEVFLGRQTDNQEMVTILSIITIIIIIISIMKMKSIILVMIRSYWRVVHIKNYTLMFNFIITIIAIIMMLIMISNENDHDQESLEGCPHIRLNSGFVLPLPLCLGHGSKVDLVLMMLTMRMMWDWRLCSTQCIGWVQKKGN